MVEVVNFDRGCSCSSSKKLRVRKLRHVNLVGEKDLGFSLSVVKILLRFYGNFYASVSNYMMFCAFLHL